MELFTFEPESALFEREKETYAISKAEIAHIGILARKKDVRLDVSKLTEQYTEHLDEIFGVIKARKSDSSGEIKVDRVTVNLGIEAGGKIGWFVEGRLDVALAFQVEFKVGD